MSEAITIAIQYARANQDRFLQDLKTLTAIPSVSTSPEARLDMQRAAEWIAAHLESLGLDQVQVMPTAGPPVVFGEWLKAGGQAPTVLVYGHYDVQPAEPLELWTSPAFEPQVRGENLYGRGVTDMKGQFLAVMDAVEAILQTSRLPVNVKFLIEGEEEIGSPSLGDFMAAHRDLLACDLALNPDTGIFSQTQPSITYALRGLAYFELRVFGPDHDLHSGLFGGIVNNPAQVLCELIASMHDPQGRITLPGFYDRVRPLSEAERQELARLPTDDATYLSQTGAPALWGETGYSPVERLGARPTLEVNGLLSGFTSEGSKTVLPARAMAKISMRLVPDQDPDEVHQQLLRYLERHAPQTVRWEVTPLGGGPASISERDSAGVRAMSSALEAVWGVRPVFKREGGSVPVVGDFKHYLGVESVNIGFSLPDDNMHAPDEKLHLPTWQRGIEAMIYFFYNLAEQ